MLLTAKTFAALLGDFTAESPCTVGDEAYCTDFTSLNDAIHADLNYYHGTLDTHIADIVAHSDDSDSSHHDHLHYLYQSSHSHHHHSSSDSDSYSFGWSTDSWFGRDRDGTFEWDSSEERFVYDGYLLPETSDSESIDHSFAQGIYKNYLERRVHYNKQYGDRHKAEYSHIYSDDSHHSDHHYYSDDYYHSDDYYTDDYYYSDHYFDDHHYDDPYHTYHYEPEPYYHEPKHYYREPEPYHYEPEPTYHAPSQAQKVYDYKYGFDSSHSYGASQERNYVESDLLSYIAFLEQKI